MKSKPFRFHPEAREDFRDAIIWYRGHSPRAAAEFRVTVAEAIRRISEAPARWPEYSYGTRRLVLARFPFSIVYLDHLDAVQIVAVAHDKRKPGYWKGRV